MRNDSKESTELRQHAVRHRCCGSIVAVRCIVVGLRVESPRASRDHRRRIRLRPAGDRGDGQYAPVVRRGDSPILCSDPTDLDGGNCGHDHPAVPSRKREINYSGRAVVSRCAHVCAREPAPSHVYAMSGQRVAVRADGTVGVSEEDAKPLVAQGWVRVEYKTGEEIASRVF
jgi:hypothetical protein